MKHIILLLVVVAALQSCKLSPCDKIMCDNGAPLEVSDKDCVCDCLPGYTGEKCDENIYEKFIGDNVQVTEYWDNVLTYSYYTNITHDYYYSNQISFSQLLLSRRYDNYNMMYASVTNNETLSFNQQNIELEDGSWYTYADFIGTGVRGGDSLLIEGTLTLQYYPYTQYDIKMICKY